MTFPKLTTLPAKLLQGALNLWQLDAHGSGLTNLPVDLFQGLGRLQQVILRENHLTSLPEGIFDSLSEMTMLSLDQNNYTEKLPKNLLVKNKKLELLAFDFNSVTPEFFDPLLKIKGFLINTEKLKYVPSNFLSRFQYLNYLIFNVHSNQEFDFIDGDIAKDLPLLTNFGIRGANLPTLPRNLLNRNTNLKQILFVDDNISSVPPGFFNNLFSHDAKDSIVYFEGNHLSMLEELTIKAQLPAEVTCIFNK